MKRSNFAVNFAILSRNSSNPKLMLGSESAIDGAAAEANGGRIVLVDSEGSNAVAILNGLSVSYKGCFDMVFVFAFQGEALPSRDVFGRC